MKRKFIKDLIVFLNYIVSWTLYKNLYNPLTYIVLNSQELVSDVFFSLTKVRK